MSENIPHSLGGFRGSFESEHGRKPTEQEIWNAAIRSWRDLHPQASEPAPAGWKLVPVDPTPEMVNAGRICPMPTDSEWDEDEDYRAVYRAMLEAAPEAK